ncbi:hypothetical protein K439DRAFT_1278066, partial [Ramaria rubella]
TLQQLWSDIEKADLPTWVGRATQLGEGTHGKLSADQWCTACTVDLPFTLIRLWGGDKQLDEKERFKDMLDNFMDLVAAAKLAFQRTMSLEISAQYQVLMGQYLEGLINLYPTSKIQP